MKSPSKPGHARAVQYVALARSAMVTLFGLLLVLRAVSSPDPAWQVGGSILAFALVCLGTWMGSRAMRRLQQPRPREDGAN
jgi:hypothetical protein